MNIQFIQNLIRQIGIQVVNKEKLSFRKGISYCKRVSYFEIRKSYLRILLNHLKVCNLQILPPFPFG